MKCPVCDNVQTSLVCPKCGFDSSRDYAKYPTFGPLGRVPSLSALRADWTQKQQESLAEPVSPVPDPAEEAVILSPVPDPAEESVILSSAPEAIGEPPQKKKPWLVITACAAIAAIILVVIVITGGFAPRSPIALTVGGTKVSAAELNHYYIDSVNSFLNFAGDYVSLFGLDTTKALDDQFYNEAEGDTWSDYFLDQATATAKNMYAVYNAAKADGFTMSDDAKASIESAVQNMAMYAILDGFPSADSYISAMYGEGCNEKTFRHYAEVQMTAQEYIAAKNESLTYDEAAIQAENDLNPAAYSAYTYNYCYLNASKFYQGGTKNEDGTTTYSDEEKEAGRAAAEAAANTLVAPTTVEELDAAYAALEINAEVENAKSTRREGVQYANVDTAVREWVTAAERKTGDIKVIPSEYTNEDGEKSVSGYYVVLFESKNENLTNLVNVRHILVSYEGGTYDETTGITTYSDAEKAAAKAKAEEILDAFNAGEKTEEAFGALATEKTTDTSSRENGGLYEDVYPRQMVAAFNDWCFDASRKTGDVGLVETEYGWHVMYFVGTSETTYRDYMIESALLSEDMAAWENGLIEASELVVADTQYIKTDLIIHGNGILPPGNYPFGAIHRPAIP